MSKADEIKKAIERIDKRLTIEKYTKNIATPIYISDLKIVLNYIEELETEKKKIIENSISKSVIENLLHKEMNRRYEASKSDLCNEKELEYRRGRTDILQEIMK